MNTNVLYNKLVINTFIPEYCAIVVLKDGDRTRDELVASND